MDYVSLTYLFDISAAETRVWILILNSVLTFANFAIIIAVINSIIKFRRKVAVQDQSRIAYLEEFKIYVGQIIQKLDTIKLQLDGIEKMASNHIKEQLKGK